MGEVERTGKVILVLERDMLSEALIFFTKTDSKVNLAVDLAFELTLLIISTSGQFVTVRVLVDQEVRSLVTTDITEVMVSVTDLTGVDAKLLMLVVE